MFGNVGRMPDRLRKIKPRHETARPHTFLPKERNSHLPAWPRRRSQTLRRERYSPRPLLRYHLRVLPHHQLWRCPSESSRKPSAWSTSREHLCYISICGVANPDADPESKASVRHPTMTISGTSMSPSTAPASLLMRVCWRALQASRLY
jgi:hypothetical protein